MRIFQHVLLVAGLTAGLIAAGVAWERFYVAPLVEQAQRRPDPPDSAAGDLSAECREELAAMGSPSAVMELRRERSAAKAAAGEAAQNDGGNVLRQGGGVNQSMMHIQVTDPSPAPAQIESDAAAHPIPQAQPAEYSEPASRPADGGSAGQRSRNGTLAASAVDSIGLGDLHDPLKSVDVLDLMRRSARRRRSKGRGPPRAGAAGLQRGRPGTGPAAFQSGRGDPQTTCAVRAAVVERGCRPMADVACLDPQPEVRLAALTTLATTGDPVLLDRVEALTRSDHDPQIQALADQIAKQRVLASCAAIRPRDEG